MKSLSFETRISVDAKVSVDVPREFAGRRATMTLAIEDLPTSDWLPRFKALIGSVQDDTFEPPADQRLDSIEDWR